MEISFGLKDLEYFNDVLVYVKNKLHVDLEEMQNCCKMMSQILRVEDTSKNNDNTLSYNWYELSKIIEQCAQIIIFDKLDPISYNLSSFINEIEANEKQAAENVSQVSRELSSIMDESNTGYISDSNKFAQVANSYNKWLD